MPALPRGAAHPRLRSPPGGAATALGRLQRLRAFHLAMDLADVPMIHHVATALELAGVAVIVLGVVLATAVFLRACLARADPRDAYNRYRADLGRGILLGLELLVGADIVATVTAPLTLESVGLLAAVVLIRTFLSFSLETEIEGRWPWRRAEAPEPDPER